MLQPAPRIEFFTASDGYRFASRVWEVENPVGRVINVHGIISHGGWYLSSCRYLAGQGFEVHYLDRRGSGLNMQSRGDVDNWNTWLDDVDDYLKSLSDDLPTVLLGVSWGGKLAAAFARRESTPLAGIGMLCPGLFARQFPNAAKYFGLHMLAAAGQNERRVMIPLQDPELFTDSAKWQEYIRLDPLTLRKVTVRFALADQQLTRYATKSPESISTPTLLQLASNDLIVDNPRTREFVESINSSDNTIIEYPNAAHTLEFEPDCSTFFNDLGKWVNARCKSTR